VLISDLFIEKPGPQKILNHVSIDRFTGGARTLAGALFDEKPYYRGNPFSLKVTITEPDKIADLKVRQALNAALEDLAQGVLLWEPEPDGGMAISGENFCGANTGKSWLAGGEQ